MPSVGALWLVRRPWVRDRARARSMAPSSHGFIGSMQHRAGRPPRTGAFVRVLWCDCCPWTPNPVEAWKQLSRVYGFGQGLTRPVQHMADTRPMNRRSGVSEKRDLIGPRWQRAVAARREPELAELAAEIAAAAGEATHVGTDVSVASDVERMVAHTVDTFGRLDYAVNNAGIEGETASITSLPEEEFDRVIAINLKGTFLCLQHESRVMLAGGLGGAIVTGTKLTPAGGFTLTI